MGLFDMDEQKIQALYHRAWVESGRGFVDPRKYPYLNKALIQYARENHCSFDEAWMLAKNGRR